MSKKTVFNVLRHYDVPGDNIIPHEINKDYGKYLHLYLNIVPTKVFAIVFVLGKFIVFVFKYFAIHLYPSLIIGLCNNSNN